MSNLGGFSEEALQLYQLATSEKGYDFSEEGETYDFTRCMRPNGTFYGTSGQCKSGSSAGAKTPTQKLKEGSANNPAVKRREADKAKRAADTQRMYDRAAQRREADAKGEGEGAPPRKLKTDFRPEVEAAAANRRERDAKREERRKRDNELRGLIQDKLVEQKPRKAELDRLERAAKEQIRKIKAEPTKENKERLKEIARQIREQERFYNRGERELEKMGRERLRIAKQNENERMTPEQRRENNRIRQIIKERG